MIYHIPLSNRLTNQRGLKASIVGLLTYDNTLFDSIQFPERLNRELIIDTILHKYANAPLANPDPEYMKYYMNSWAKTRIDIWNKWLDTLEYDYNPIHNYDRTAKLTDTRDATTLENRDFTQNHNAVSSVDQSTDRDVNQTTNISDTTDGTTEDSGTTRISNDTETDSTNEHTVSAENASTYQPDNRDTRHETVSGTQNTTVSANSRSNTTRSSEQTDTSTEVTKNKSQEDANTTTTHKASDDSTLHDVTVHIEEISGNIGVTTTQQMIQSQRDIVNFSLYLIIADEWYDEFCLKVW